MPVGIIVAIVTAILIVVIASGAGYYYYTKPATDDSTTQLSDVDASGAQVATGITSTVDGPVATIDRTSNISGSTSAALASAAADSGAVTATPIAPTTTNAAPIQGGPALPHQSGVVTAPSAPVSVGVTAPVITQPAAPSATVVAPQAAPKIQPDQTIEKLNSLIRRVDDIIRAIPASPTTSDKEKALRELDKVLSDAIEISKSAQDSFQANKKVDNIRRKRDSVAKNLSTTNAQPTPTSSGSLFGIKTPPAPTVSTQNVAVAPAPTQSVFGITPKPPAPVSTPAPTQNIFGVATAPKTAPTQNIFGVTPAPKTAPTQIIFGVATAPKTTTAPAPTQNIFGVATAPKTAPTQNIFGVATAPKTAPTQNIFGVATAPKPIGTVAAPLAPTWDPKIPRLSELLIEIDQVHNVVVRSNADFDTKLKTSKALPSVEILTLSTNQEIKNADPKTDAAKSFTVTRDVYRRKIDEVVAIIKAGPPAPKQSAPVSAAPPPAIKPPTALPTVSPVVSAGAAQYNVFKAQIDTTLKTALDPKATDAQKINEAKKLPSLQTYAQAVDRALADARATPGVVTNNLVASIQKEAADYSRRLTQALTILDALKISPCGNTKDSAALLGCRAYPYSMSPLGQCAKDRTGVACAPGTGCNGKICVQGPPTGVLKYVNAGALLAFFK